MSSNKKIVTLGDISTQFMSPHKSFLSHNRLMSPDFTQTKHNNIKKYSLKNLLSPPKPSVNGTDKKKAWKWIENETFNKPTNDIVYTNINLQYQILSSISLFCSHILLTCTLSLAWILEETKGLAMVIDRIIAKANVSRLTDNPSIF